LIFAEDPLDMHVKATRLLHPPLIPQAASIQVRSSEMTPNWLTGSASVPTL